MGKGKSKFKEIFEDNSLSDFQKYKKINNLHNKGSRFWIIVIGLNAVMWPLLLVTPNVEIDNPKLSPVAALKG